MTTENQKKTHMCRRSPLVLSACCISIVSVNEVPGCQWQPCSPNTFLRIPPLSVCVSRLDHASGCIRLVLSLLIEKEETSYTLLYAADRGFNTPWSHYISVRLKKEKKSVTMRAEAQLCGRKDLNKDVLITNGHRCILSEKKYTFLVTLYFMVSLLQCN